MIKKSSPSRYTQKSRGGKRDGAGRPHGSGRYGEPTKAIRVPLSLVNDLQQFLTQYDPTKNATISFVPPELPSTMQLPFYDNKIAAGFPSPADDAINTYLDLNTYLIQNPATTFYVRVQGDSMINAGIHPEDLLMVDRSLKPLEGHVVIAYLDGEFTVKRLKMLPDKKFCLMPENEKYAPILIKEEMECRIWGVVTNVIHSLT